MALSTKSKALLGAVAFFSSVPFIWPRPPEANTRNEPEARSIATEFVELIVSDSWRRGAGLAVPPESDEGEGCIYSDHAADLGFVPSARHGRKPLAHNLTGSASGLRRGSLSKT